MSSIYQDIIDWCRGKNWLLRLPFLIWFTVVLIRHLSDPTYYSILKPLNLGIHELGHLVFSPFGIFLSVLGGTLFQLLIPILSVFNFFRQRDYFSITLCFGWLSTNLFGIARYVGDARSMSLPLVSPFGGATVKHDWNYLLSKMHLLEFDSIIAFLLRGVAVFSMAICLSTGSWILWQMKKKIKDASNL